MLYYKEQFWLYFYIFIYYKAEHCPEVDLTTQVPEEVEPEPVSVTTISKDLFSLYSLSFVCKAKDLSERRIKLDFGLVAEVK